MAAWSGFTDEDLRKMRTVSQEGNSVERRQASKKAMARNPKVSAQRQRTTKPTAQRIEPAQSLQQTKSDEVVLNKEKGTNQEVDNFTNNNASDQEVNKQSQLPETVVRGNEEKALPVAEVKELNTDQALSMERDNVAKFQQQQKVIEEANKQKRALLSKAIEERRKMAKAESEKLLKIQRELNRLDDLLNVDVGIIRDKIEIASLDYVSAQKRYEKAEKEFIEAKMDLFDKSESKERLTEHLYTIINQNEVRKAKKLVELMEQLAMQITPEEMELTIPAIPQLTNFNAVSTIHHPRTDGQKQETETAEDGNCKQKGNEVEKDNSNKASLNKDDNNTQNATGLNERGDGNQNTKVDTIPSPTPTVITKEKDNSQDDIIIGTAVPSSTNKISEQQPSQNHDIASTELQSQTSVEKSRGDNLQCETSSLPTTSTDNSETPALPSIHEDIVPDKNHDNALSPDNTTKVDDKTNNAKGWSLPFK